MSTQNGSPTSSPPSLRKGVVELAHDVATLSDLQLKLLSADTRLAYDGSRGPALAAVIGVVLVVGAMPILLLGAAHWLTDSLEWPLSASCTVVAVAAIAAGLLTVWLAVRGISASLQSFQRSRNEFRENVQWIQRAIRTQGHMHTVRPRESELNSPVRRGEG